MILDMDNVDASIRVFLVKQMIKGRLHSYKQELKDIRDQFIEFSAKVATFETSPVSTEGVPRARYGTEMNVNYWRAKKQELE